MKITIRYEFSEDQDRPYIASTEHPFRLRCWGRSLRETRKDFLLALETAPNWPGSPCEIVDDFSALISSNLQDQVTRLRELEDAIRQLPALRTRIARLLIRRGISLRDASVIMGGISFQRISLLTRHGRPRKYDRRRNG